VLPPPRGRLILAVLATGMLAGCLGATPSAPAEAIPESLQALSVTTVALDGRTLRVAVADTNEARQRGLMGVADLGPLDGLLFAYPAPVETSFHMRNVPIPLDIAFFDAAGHFVAIIAMAVCEAEPCPSYRSPAGFRWALEAPAGDLAGVDPGATLSLGPSP
jgi:uncharacterized membrane protein (UPF0127 family)